MQEKREFQVHDRVVTRRVGYGTVHVGSIYRMTKTQVLVKFEGLKGEFRYRRDNGYVVGESGSLWGRTKIRHATDMDLQDIAWQKLKSLAGRLDKIAQEHGRKDAVLQIQIAADKFISHLSETEDQL